MNTSVLPQLDYDVWKKTYETLHRWTQIVGKVRLCKEPWINHSWHSTLYVTSRGLGTSAVADGSRNFSIELDFLDHKIHFQTSDGKSRSLPLLNESVALFYERFMSVLGDLDIKVNFDPRPNEIADDIPFSKDLTHCTYDRDQAHTAWQVFVQANNMFQEFRSFFVGKCSPVHFFWGGFDLAVTRFSGRVAPEHPGGIPHLSDRVTREAYSHEVFSCGFWPGNDMYPQAAFYSYAYPEPPGFKAAAVPKGAAYHEQFREFFLPYEVVRKSKDPKGLVMQFLQSTYDAAADLGHWDRQSLEVSPYLSASRDYFQTKDFSPHPFLKGSH
jgi:hypothetical protein